MRFWICFSLSFLVVKNEYFLTQCFSLFNFDGASVCVKIVLPIHVG